MKKIQWVLRFFAICVVAFAAGIVTGFVKNGVEEINGNATEDIYENVQTVTVEEETLIYEPKKLMHYLVMSDGDYIVLAEVFDDESKNVVEMISINKSVLPKADIVLLQEGMTFEEKDEALLMIENFVS